MRIAYVLPDTPLFGGIKVPLLQAELLKSRGVEATIVAPGSRPSWFPLTVNYHGISSLENLNLPEVDLVIATFWTTINPSLAAASGPVVHYCQGFEFTYTHNLPEHEAILEAYAAPLPAVTVSPHLGAELANRFGRSSRVIRQPMESFWFQTPRRKRSPGAIWRVVLVSPYEIDWKGVETGLRAVALLRQKGHRVHLTRISQWPIPEEEKELAKADETHQALKGEEIAQVLRSADLLLAPSWEQEGFGLPSLEAMACGTPVIASDISCYRAWAREGAVLVPCQNPQAFAEATERLLLSPSRWRRQRRKGLRTAARYRPQYSSRSALSAFSHIVEEAKRGS